MSTTNINVRVDSSLKKDAEELFGDLGMNISTAITLFLKSAVRNNGIPFELKRNQPNPDTVRALSEYDEMKNNPKKYKRYKNADELFDEVLADV